MMGQLNHNGLENLNKEDSMLETSFRSDQNNPNRYHQPYAIVECLPQNKKTTLQDKSYSCEINSQIQKSSKMSEVDLISKEKDFKPFYNDYCKEISSLLLSHIEIDCADSDSNSLNSYSKKTRVKSWFSMIQNYHLNQNSQKTSCQFFTSSLVGCTGLEDIQTKSKKIRIYPTQEQKILFKKWLGISRLFYNKTVDFYNNQDKTTVNWMEIAKQLTTILNMDYIKAIPYQIKKIAVKDCSISYFSNCKKTKQTKKPFKLSFKSKKDLIQSCYIPKDAVRKQGIYYRISGNLKYSEKDWLNDEFCDCRLISDKGRWFICIPVKTKNTNIIEKQNDIVGLDPGIRTFITYFSVNGHFGHIGYHSFNRIQALCFKLDKIISKISKEKDKHKKSSLKRLMNRIKWKINNLVDELHWKTINYLVKNFGIIILPTFETSEMVVKKKRKLNSKSARNMLTYRFYEFSKRLEVKCKEYGVKLVRINESYTSKTNSFTGEIIKNLGGKEYFKYDKIFVNRDINGSRNILLRYLRDSSVII